METGHWPRGFDPTREVLLEDIEDDTPRSGVDEHAGYARVIKYRNTVVEIEVHAQGPAISFSTTPIIRGGVRPSMASRRLS